MGIETEDFRARYHSTLGVGEPVASQQRLTVVPFNITTSEGGLLVNFGGTKEKNNDQINIHICNFLNRGQMVWKKRTCQRGHLSFLQIHIHIDFMFNHVNHFRVARFGKT